MGILPDRAETGVKGDNYVHNAQGIIPIQMIELWNKLCGRIIQQVKQGCDGVQNILDDIIVHASNQEEHDKRLEKELNVLQGKGFTLNRDAREFNMPKLEFMGLVLSECGVGPKVSAVLNAREPMSVSEVRSW